MILNLLYRWSVSMVVSLWVGSAMDWWPNLGVTCLLPNGNWDRLQVLWPWKGSSVNEEWMNKLLNNGTVELILVSGYKMLETRFSPEWRPLTENLVGKPKERKWVWFNVAKKEELNSTDSVGDTLINHQQKCDLGSFLLHCVTSPDNPAGVFY